MADVLRLIRESVQADIDAGEDLYILEESDSEFTIVDDTEGYGRDIRYIVHDRITPAWLEERILVTESAKQCRYTVNTKILAEYLTRVVPKDVLHTLEKIIIVTDDEKDWEELFPQLEDRHGNPILEVCDLPDEGLVGYQWAMYQVVLINLKAIIDAARELWPMVGMMVKSEVNTGVCTTLLHELFHMAQNDPYAPEELFKGLPKDPEQAAEAWAINTWETDGEYVLNQLKEEPT